MATCQFLVSSDLYFFWRNSFQHETRLLYIAYIQMMHRAKQHPNARYRPLGLQGLSERCQWCGSGPGALGSFAFLLQSLLQEGGPKNRERWNTVELVWRPQMTSPWYGVDPIWPWKWQIISLRFSLNFHAKLQNFTNVLIEWVLKHHPATSQTKSTVTNPFPILNTLNTSCRNCRNHGLLSLGADLHLFGLFVTTSEVFTGMEITGLKPARRWARKPMAPTQWRRPATDD